MAFLSHQRMWHHLPLIAVELCISRAIVGDVLPCSVLCGHNITVDLNIPTLRCLLSRIEERAIQKVDFLPTMTQNSLQMQTNKCCISQSELSNYESDTNLLLLEVFGTPSKQCANDTAVIATNDALSITEFAAIGVNSLPQQNALFYHHHSSLGSRCVPWLGEGLSMPSPNDPVLCFPLLYRVAPVFVQVVSPPLGWSPLTSFLVIWSPSGDARCPSVVLEAVDMPCPGPFHFSHSVDYIYEFCPLPNPDVGPSIFVCDVEHTLFYVGGYICKKYLAKHSCKECTALYFVIDML